MIIEHYLSIPMLLNEKTLTLGDILCCFNLVITNSMCYLTYTAQKQLKHALKKPSVLSSPGGLQSNRGDEMNYGLRA